MVGFMICFVVSITSRLKFHLATLFPETNYVAGFMQCECSQKNTCSKMTHFDLPPGLCFVVVMSDSHAKKVRKGSASKIKTHQKRKQ